MDLPRTMAGGLSVTRILFGLTYVLRPRSAGPSWIGRSARRPPTQVLARSQGIRDVVLGAGALLALTRGDASDARRWVAGHALADATDFAATWVARDRLPRSGSRLALAAAAVSSAVAATAAATLRPPR
jgi:hypothetical protein